MATGDTGEATRPEKVDSTPGKTSADRRRAKAALPAGQGQAEQSGPCEPTEYARNRPRRAAAGLKNAMGHTTESLELLKCLEFVGPPGSGGPQSQPFHVDVHPEVHVPFKKLREYLFGPALGANSPCLLCCFTLEKPHGQQRGVVCQ
jgi:hypothetical protein